uniref:Uncharacterized protein n=1 Tax=Solanum tuberosum TaxID=4113 RepID=M1BIC6_SOLTU
MSPNAFASLSCTRLLVVLDGLISTSPPRVLLPKSLLCNDWILEGLASADPASKECFIFDVLEEQRESNDGRQIAGSWYTFHE